MNDKILTIIFILISLSLGIWFMIERSEKPKEQVIKKQVIVEQPEAVKKYYEEKKYRNLTNVKKHRYWKYPKENIHIKSIEDVCDYYTADKKHSFVWTIEDYWILSMNKNTNISKYGEKYAKEVKDFYKEIKNDN